MKVLFTYDYGKNKLDSIRDLGYEVVYKKEREISKEDNFEDIDILVCYNPFDNLDISKMKNLKWIQLSSIGIDQLPIEKLKGRDIIVTNFRGGYSIPMGEWIILKILEIYKDSKYFYERQREKKWKVNPRLLELYGKTVGFLGTGTISIEGAKRLQGFRTKILGLNTKGRDMDYFDKCFSIDEIDSFLSLCDVVVCALPYTKETHHLLNYDRLSLMKDKSVFINVSRGSVVDEKALIEKIREGKFLGVALDVFEEEPLKEDSPLWGFENVYISPHNSWISEKRDERRFKIIYDNMERFKKGEELINIVDISRGY